MNDDNPSALIFLFLTKESKEKNTTHRKINKLLYLIVYNFSLIRIVHKDYSTTIYLTMTKQYLKKHIFLIKTIFDEEEQFYKLFDGKYLAKSNSFNNVQQKNV